jgi:dolichyl-phosphate beta-glucosyltransferase
MTAGAARRAIIVVPCFDERSRLRGDELLRLVERGDCALLLVDDGSTDGTGELLASLAASHPAITSVSLATNMGKGEAVRRGLQLACRTGTELVGYLDADLATPVDEMLRLIDLAVGAPQLEVVMASRVALLGRDIRRSPFRHYTGRLFATLASLVLQRPVYDTQCGAKLFRIGDALDRALAQPFVSRWAFDVELLGRLANEGVPTAAFREEPLERWADIADSRRSVRSSVRSTLELWSIREQLRR